MEQANETRRLVEARRLIASGYTREVRLAAGLSYRRCSAGTGGMASDVAILNWERQRHVPSRNAAGAIAYVDFIRQVMRDLSGAVADAS